jgi:hypothetical protein
MTVVEVFGERFSIVKGKVVEGKNGAAKDFLELAISSFNFEYGPWDGDPAKCLCVDLGSYKSIKIISFDEEGEEPYEEDVFY